MKPVILFRKSYDLESEFQTAKKYFEVVESRMNLTNRLVIPRYSALPFYRELERDLQIQGSRMINNYMEHDYIASFDYYFDLQEFTPKSYFSLQDVPRNSNKQFVVKGKTNSRKQQWKEKMFASDYQSLVNLYLELSSDPLIGSQGVVIREFEPLENFGTGLNGLDFANEWRFFFYKNTLLSYGYYWSSGDIIPEKTSLDPQALELASEIAQIASQRTNFFVLDLAKTKAGKWILIEMNDGQMSGLSENNADELYANLAKAIESDKE